VTENQLEDRSSNPVSVKLRRVTKWSYEAVGLSTPTVVVAHREITSTTVNGDCTTSRLRNVWHVELDGGMVSWYGMVY